MYKTLGRLCSIYKGLGMLIKIQFILNILRKHRKQSVETIIVSIK